MQLEERLLVFVPIYMYLDFQLLIVFFLEEE